MIRERTAGTSPCSTQEHGRPVAELPGAGHYNPEGAPGEVWCLVSEFIA